MIFAKYQYPSQSIWNNLKKSIQSEEAYIDCAVHEIGNICLETDEEGNCINLDPNYAVDIMWFKEIPKRLTSTRYSPTRVAFTRSQVVKTCTKKDTANFSPNIVIP
jgi:hypothetical protein